LQTRNWSGKPAARADYRYECPIAWRSPWRLSLDLSGITLFCQDWRGLLGLRLVDASPDR
jgi:haloalkane dehalogenase